MRTLEGYAALIEDALKGALPRAGEYDGPIIEACNYSLLAGGKRLRPALTLAAAEFLGIPVQEAMPFALAVEMVHSYSLVHDDLPAMDNDTLRRGKPTNHVVYGEAMAILAGDALLTESFALMLGAALGSRAYTAENALRAAHCLALYAGIKGMVGGQAQDILSERANAEPDEALLCFIHDNKTAALITASILMGLHLGGADEETLACFAAYGKAIGRMFQIADDLLDVESTQGRMGKSIGKDQKSGKLTSLCVYGIDGARKKLESYAAEAKNAIQGMNNAEFFDGLIDMLKQRDH